MHANPITPEQMDILDRFCCERLSADPNNLYNLFSSFENRSAPSIVDLVRHGAFTEDSRGYTSHYVVKTEDDMILMVFALKCGLLFNAGYEAGLLDRYDRYTKLASAQNLSNLDEGLRQKLIEKRCIESEYQYLMFDIDEDPNPHHIRVEEPIPAVELMYMCTNDNARDTWKALGLNRSMGETLFWHFIVPKVLEINRLVGCAYLYSFIPDSSPDKALIRYYLDVLHFESATEFGTAKGTFNFGCPMVYQPLVPGVKASHPSNLAENQKNFYNTFNSIADADDAWV